MRCYIWGSNNRDNRSETGRGVACFVIPDWGIQFRAVHFGDAFACECAALKALLRFAEENPKLFERERIEALTDASQLIEQLNGRASIGPIHEQLLASIRALRERVKFELAWVPPEQNRAILGVLELPPLKRKFKIEHSHTPKRASEPNSREFNS